MFNQCFKDFLAYNKLKIDFNENHNDIMEECSIMIQSAFRGYFIRFQINNRLKAYKGIVILVSFFKNKIRKILKKNYKYIKYILN